ncbi:MFS transporter [Nonomuraea gerenzanensis]|uniref:Major facilitator superfamily MFS_1 n=2 Tax=Nonomuraea gerenzanensis TaxID=93944 RepID=A0A1M4DZ06_9ACTN|nr:MFS transporter [Nonomuraea gerenzanensis]UBU14115.1 MFS transporter [Nonomuraea gerenzanensis]SBO91803.1 major facilitator superfamily MFS_1 [Nonomuraea gerenzanensis]
MTTTPAGVRGGVVGLLGMRDFRLLWAGETASMLGSSVAAVALPLVAVVTLHADTFTVGLLTAAAWLPWLVTGLPAGAWVDRLPKRPVMLTCDAVSLTAFGSVPLAAWLGGLTMTHLLVVATVGGVARVFFTLAYRAYLPALVGSERLLEANAKLQGSESAAQIAGPGLAGLLAHAFGAVSGVLADAISFGIAALCLRAVRTREPAHRRTGSRAVRHPETRKRWQLLAEIRDGVRFVIPDPYLRTLTLFSAMSNIAIMGYHSIQVVFLSRHLGAGSAQIGLVLALAGAGGLFGATLAGRIAARFGTARGFLLCEAFAAPMMLLGPMGNGPALFTVSGFCTGAGIVASNILTSTFRQQYCPPELFGRITASAATLNYGAIPLGGLLGGLLGESIGVRETMSLMAAVQLASLTILLLSPIRRSRDFPALNGSFRPQHGS